MDEYDKFCKKAKSQIDSDLKKLDEPDFSFLHSPDDINNDSKFKKGPLRLSAAAVLALSLLTITFMRVSNWWEVRNLIRQDSSHFTEVLLSESLFDTSSTEKIEKSIEWFDSNRSLFID